MNKDTHRRLILESLLTFIQTLGKKALLEYLWGLLAAWNFCEDEHMKLGVRLIDIREYIHLSFTIPPNHSILVLKYDLFLLELSRTGKLKSNFIL